MLAIDPELTVLAILVKSHHERCLEIAIAIVGAGHIAVGLH